MTMEISQAGVQRAQNLMSNTARQFASLDSSDQASTVNISQLALNQNIAESQFRVNAEMIKAQDEMVGTMLDVLA
ncbi:MAG: hypothetical protein ABEJ65_05630 [bacterium]